MRLLTATDFALRALMLLAQKPEGSNTDDMARELAISRNHLQKVVQSLAALGVVRTQRGAKGGVTLAKATTDIVIGEVVRAFESDQAVVECFRSDGGACTLTRGCRLKGMLAGARESFFSRLDGFTLAECLTPAPSEDEAGTTERI